MFNKKILTTSICAVSLTGMLAAQTFPVFAQNITTPVTNGTTKLADNLSDIKSRGDSLINQRLTTLNNLLVRINSVKHLKSTDKATFTNSINSDIRGLTALKTKIDGDTDVATARADVKSIFTTFRVYAVFVPQIHELAGADVILDIADMLDSLASKLDVRISEASSKGNDVTSLKILLSDMRSNIADARTGANSVESQIAGLTPSSYPGSTPVLQNARSEIQKARKDLQTSWSDGKQIIITLRGFRNSATAAPSASVTK